MREVEITNEPIELYKILKFENLVSSGGEAKYVINDGQVLVNGEVETRKRKQIVSGDTIEFQGEKLLIKLKAT
jgi:ribosome-associated protein